MKKSNKLIIIYIAIGVMIPFIQGLVLKDKIQKNDYVLKSTNSRLGIKNTNGKLSSFNHVNITSNNNIQVEFNIFPADTSCFYLHSSLNEKELQIQQEVINDTLYFNCTFNKEKSQVIQINIATPHLKDIIAKTAIINIIAGENNNVFDSLNIYAQKGSTVNLSEKNITQKRDNNTYHYIDRTYPYIFLSVDEQSLVNIENHARVNVLKGNVSGKLQAGDNVIFNNISVKYNDSADIYMPSDFYKKNNLTNN